MSQVTIAKRFDSQVLHALIGPFTCAGSLFDGSEVTIVADIAQNELERALAAYVWAEPPERANERTLDQRAEAAMAGLRTLTNGTGTLTAVQLTAGLRLCARALLVLVRLQLRRLDATD